MDPAVKEFACKKTYLITAEKAFNKKIFFVDLLCVTDRIRLLRVKQTRNADKSGFPC